LPAKSEIIHSCRGKLTMDFFQGDLESDLHCHIFHCDNLRKASMLCFYWLSGTDIHHLKPFIAQLFLRVS